MEGYIGEIRYFAGTFAPAGWNLCSGQQLSIANNEALFVLIGTIYGGDGVSTFNLPNFGGRAAVGAGQGAGLSMVVLGQVSGSEQVTLLSQQLPTHTHVVENSPVNPGFTVSVNNGQGSVNTPTNGVSMASAGYMSSGSFVQNLGFNTQTPNIALNPATVDLTSVVNNSVAGSSLPHNNMQPYLAVNFIICTQGIFPSRN